MDITKAGGAGVAAAEKDRDARRHTGFIGNLFRGKASFGLLNVTDSPNEEEKKTADRLLSELRDFLMARVNADQIDHTNEVPADIFQWLCERGYFGLKVAKEYGGHGLHQTQYSRVLGVVASWTGSLAAPLSAANTIGLSFPLKAYGSEEQKKQWLPTVAKVPTGFAFTEKEAGSDPANMQTVAVRVKDANGNITGYKLTGEKWWTTNGPKSDTEFLSPLLCVIAKAADHPDDLKNPGYKPVFVALLVQTNLSGIKIVQRCDFAGLNGICNGITQFENVDIPVGQRIGQEGDGFKMAIAALNTGRLSIAGLATAVSKQAVLMGTWNSKNRVQWGRPVVQHEMVGSGLLVPSLAKILAMEAMTWLASRRVDDDLDARLEAAACKVHSTECGWQIMDAMMQAFGGRGYETAMSLAKRGLPALPMERLWRDFRINRTFEGSSEILTLWALREGSDEYKKIGEVFFGPGNYGKKIKSALWFAKEMAALMVPKPISGEAIRLVNPRLRRHLKFVEKYSRRLALTLILSSARYQAKMIFKQLLFQRLFWAVTELYAIAALCHYVAIQLGNDPKFVDLADYYCREAESRVKSSLALVKLNLGNTDALARKIGKQLVAGEYDTWLKKDIAPIVDHLKLK